MTKRRLFRISIGLGLLICVALGSLLIYRATLVPESVRVFKQVAIGMSEVEVARNLEPYFAQSEHLDVLALDATIQMVADENGQAAEMDPGQRYANWLDSERTYGVQVAFNREGRATHKLLIQYHYGPSIFERLRLWLRF